MYLLYYQKLLLGICSLWHGIEISVMVASVSSISGIPVLGHPPSWCTLIFNICFVVWHNTEHNCGQAASLTDTTFANWELAVNMLHKVKSVKTILSNTYFVQITKSDQDLM
jgi:hypothetical protein